MNDDSDFFLQNLWVKEFQKYSVVLFSVENIVL